MGLSQSYTNALDWLKGWPSQHAIDVVGKADPAIVDNSRPITGGRVVHASGYVSVGKAAYPLFAPGATGTQVALFTIQSETDFDVANPGFGVTDPNGWTATAPSGNMSALSSTGSFELQSTEIDTTSGNVYGLGDPLHSPTAIQISGADKSAAGKLFKARNWPGGNGAAVAPYTDHICAVVSRPQALNYNRRPVVSFYPVWLPSVQNVTNNAG